MSARAIGYAVLAVVVLALAGAGWFVAARWHELERQLLQERKAAEAAELRAQGAIVAKPASADELERRLAEAQLQGSQLRNEIDRLRKIAPSTKVTEVVDWTTEPIRLQLPAVDGSSSPASGDGATPPLPSPGVNSCPSVEIQVSGSEARLETDKNNVAAAGEVYVDRTSPPPRERVAVRPWKADLTQLWRLEKPEDRPPRWSAELRLGADTTGRLRLGGSGYGRGRLGGWADLSGRLGDRESLVVAGGLAIRVGP